MRMQLLSGSFTRPVWAVALWLSISAWGQTVPSDEPAVVRPAVVVERQGRLLVLNYEAVGADDQASTQREPTGPPEFTIYQGKRKVASGQFEYG